MDPITVLIVDDHTVAREGLRAFLETDPQVRVLAEAVDGLEAVRLVAKLNPNVVLMDVRMPRMDGLEATGRITAAHPATSVIILTSYEDDLLLVDAVLAGAAGYLLKDVSRDLLTHTIQAVASGGILIKANLMRNVFNRLGQTRQQVDARSLARGEIKELSPREQEVLQHIADGQSNKDIACALSLAEVTVKKYVQSITAKLHASDRTQAATTAMRLGLIM